MTGQSGTKNGVDEHARGRLHDAVEAGTIMLEPPAFAFMALELHKKRRGQSASANERNKEERPKTGRNERNILRRVNADPRSGYRDKEVEMLVEGAARGRARS